MRITDPFSSLFYPNAGHGIAALVPYEPFASGLPGAPVAGANRAANPTAVANLWPRVLAFLANPARAS